jgi:type I restriction enzyme R subunit
LFSADSSAKEFLSDAIDDYNAGFKTNFGVDSNGFQNYYRDLAATRLLTMSLLSEII